MRNHLRRFIELTNETINLQAPIFEFGALQVHGNSALEDLRPPFPAKSYVGCDMRPGPGVDRVLNLHHLDLPDGAVGTAICITARVMHAKGRRDGLRAALEEIDRCSNAGGD